MTNITKKVLKLFVDVLTVAIFLVLVLIISAKVKMMVSGKDYFELFGYSVFTVATGSMEPAISQNDVIIVKKYDKYKVNDITTFISDNAFVTHRIISIKGHDIVTKGDANNAKDAIVKDTDIIGKVIKIIPNGAVWQKVFTSPLTIIMIFVTLIMFDFAFSYKGNKKQKQLVTPNNQKIGLPLKKLFNKKQEENKVNEVVQNPVQEIKQVQEIEQIQQVESNQVEPQQVDPNFNPDYTVRLDLDELMKQIDNHMNGDDNV